MFLRRKCRDIAALIVAREDRPLRPGEQIALKLHLVMCKTCPTFEKQLLTMRNALLQWRNYTES